MTNQPQPSEGTHTMTNPIPTPTAPPERMPAYQPTADPRSQDGHQPQAGYLPRNGRQMPAVQPAWAPAIPLRNANPDPSQPRPVRQAWPTQYTPEARYAQAPQYASPGGYPPQPATHDLPPRPGCGFGEAIKRYWHGYAHFSGRSSRSEYWYAILFQTLVGMGASLIPIIGPLAWWCASLIPGIAVGVRRFHDQNLPGGAYAAMYAAGMLANIPTMVGSIGFLAAYGSYDGPQLPEPGWWTIWLATGALLTTVYTIATVLLMCRPSDPRGIRFDR